MQGKPAEEMSLYTMRALSEMMHPSGTINFLMTDSTWEKCASLPPPLPSFCVFNRMLG